MESKEETAPVIVTFMPGSPGVAVMFPNREPFVIWDRKQLAWLVLDLIDCCNRWDHVVEERNAKKS